MTEFGTHDRSPLTRIQAESLKLPWVGSAAVGRYVHIPDWGEYRITGYDLQSDQFSIQIMSQPRL